MTQHPWTHHPHFLVLRPSNWTKPNLRTRSTLLEPSATGKVSWVQSRTEWKIVFCPGTIHPSIHPWWCGSGCWFTLANIMLISLLPGHQSSLFLFDSSKGRSGHKTSGGKWSLENKQSPLFLLPPPKGEVAIRQVGKKWSLENKQIEPRLVQYILFRSKLFLEGLVEVHKCGRSSKYLIPYIQHNILFRFQLFHFWF